MFRWFDAAGLSPAIAGARLVAACVRSHLPGWFLYSVPDAAWASCGVLLFAAIWSGSSHPARHLWVSLAPSLALAANFPRFAPERQMYSTSQESKFVTCPVRIDASQKLAPIQPRRPASTSHEYVIDRERATHLCVNHANSRPEFNCCGRDSSPRPVEDVTRSLENVAARKRCTECRDHNCVARPG